MRLCGTDNLELVIGLTKRFSHRTFKHMKIVADTSTFLAVALEEAEKNWLIEMTEGKDLVAPPILPYEIANALSSLVRRQNLNGSQVDAVWDVATAIPVKLEPIDIRAALLLAAEYGIYAYDAFFLQCSIMTGFPLLTLDKGMKFVAEKLRIEMLVEK